MSSSVGAVSCGDNIISNLTLATNLSCAGDGLIIAADNITLDCQGHVLEGYANATGVKIEYYNGVAVKNCIIWNFTTGIYLMSSNRSNIIDNELGWGADGIYLTSYSIGNNITRNNLSYYYRGIETRLYSHNTHIHSNNLSRIPYSIIIYYTDNNTVESNDIYVGVWDGIYVVDSDNNTIVLNTVRNTSDAISINDDCLFNNISGNTLINNNMGITFWKSYYNTISYNLLRENTFGIDFRRSENNTIVFNNATYGGRDGIRFWDGAIANYVYDNILCYNNQSNFTVVVSVDINDEDSNIGDNNTCDTTYNYKDVSSTTACLFTCAGELMTSTTTTTTSSTSTSTSTTTLNHLKVHFINVTQGDAILVVAPNGRAMLVDTGPSRAADYLTTYLSGEGVTSLDYVVITHPDADHYGEFEDLTSNVTIQQLYDNGDNSTGATWDTYMALRTTLNYTNISQGFSIDLDPRLNVTVLWPPIPLPFSSKNDNSIVIKIVYENTSYLLTGNCEADCEAQLLNTSYNLTSTVLKVAHYGSNSSTTQAFLDAVKPNISVISVGPNAYGHPSATVISRLEAAGSVVYRTDGNGSLVVMANGASVSPRLSVFVGVDLLAGWTLISLPLSI